MTYKTEPETGNSKSFQEVENVDVPSQKTSKTPLPNPALDVTNATLDASWASTPSDPFQSSTSHTSLISAEGQDEVLLGGRYLVEELVGAGGMSVVYRAHDLQEDCKVAIKHLNPQFLHREKYIEKELLALQRLDHPGVIKVRELKRMSLPTGQSPLCLVMDFAQGKTLKEHLLTWELKTKEDMAWVADVIIACCEAVGHIHQQQVVHRDLKPENILVTLDGEVKVIDFGLASLGFDGASQNRACGTYFYTAPEVLAGEEISPHSDVYSLGMILYEMLTGLRTTGNLTRPSDFFKEQGLGAPPFPAALDAVIMKAADGLAEKRHHDANDLGLDIQKALRSATAQTADLHISQRLAQITTPPQPDLPGPSKVRPLSLLLLACLLLFLSFDLDDFWGLFASPQTSGRSTHSNALPPLPAPIKTPPPETIIGWGALAQSCSLSLPTSASKRCFHLLANSESWVRLSPIKGVHVLSQSSSPTAKTLANKYSPQHFFMPASSKRLTLCARPGPALTLTLARPQYQITIGPFLATEEAQLMVESKLREMGLQASRSLLHKSSKQLYFALSGPLSPKKSWFVQKKTQKIFRQHEELFPDAPTIKIQRLLLPIGPTKTCLPTHSNSP